MKQGGKTQRVMDAILQQIRSGRLGKGARIPSEYALAKAHRVNKTIANKAVTCLVERGMLSRGRGRAGTVVAKSHDYPCATVAFVISGLATGSFAPRLLEGAESAAFARHYALQFLHWPDRKHEAEFWSLIRESSIHGLLAFGGSVPTGMPFPILYTETRRAEKGSDNWVVSDDFQGGFLVAKHLLGLGHRDAAFLRASHLKNDSDHRRAQGFAKALQEHGVGNIANRVICLYPGGPSLNATLETLSKSIPTLTALAFDRDFFAQQAILFYEKKRMHVPRDISITGYGMGEECHFPMRIETVDQQPRHLAYHAANRLFDLIEGKCKAPIQEVLPVEVIPGETVAAHDR